MNINIAAAKLREIKLLPVVKLESAADAPTLAEALIRGGLPAIELTFRTDAAEESICHIKARFPDMLVGAGTVINVEQAKRALDASADFLVSPGLNDKLVEYAQQQDVAIFPGCCTATEIMKALEHGLSILKYFPANIYGGIQGLKTIAAVFPTMRFMPTGGVNCENMEEYLSFERVIAVGGSWMVKDTLIRAGDFSAIERLTREAVEKILRISG